MGLKLQIASPNTSRPAGNRRIFVVAPPLTRRHSIAGYLSKRLSGAYRREHMRGGEFVNECQHRRKGPR